MNEMFLKNSIPLWKHVSYNVFHVFTNSFYKVRIKSQNTLRLNNDYTDAICKVYKDDFEFNATE